MMRLTEALDKLENATAAAGLTIRRERYSENALSQLKGILSREDLADIQASGYPGGAVIPWMAEDLELYDLEKLEEHQVGYRTDAKSGSISAGWLEDRYVFADASANPFVVDSDGAVHFARHGAGSWGFERVADDLATFIEVLAEGVEFFLVENGRNIMDDDFEVLPEKVADIHAEVLAKLDERGKSAFIKALGI